MDFIDVQRNKILQNYFIVNGYFTVFKIFTMESISASVL
ncbi:hypothetical protein DFQ03_3732 [Maribacter caenipelagi]|uniref:Uncharacterized protein n=1 Tax=Maribacter caenipelagi TaxID=1447781 RepID=A0A4R7CW11_9FLAO|nr:hypothetical protein DFQ03_3732 [Maribacter caenipelagi]